MNQTNVYEKCPVYQEEDVTLQHTRPEDAEELLRCYSDKKAVPFFNADNCWSDFHYKTLQQVQEVIARWDDAYQRKLWVRWTIIHNKSNEKVGTVEMFNKGVLTDGGSYGILRIDLRSDYENRAILQTILRIANQHFYGDFAVKSILTKAVPEAKERILALTQMEYVPISFEKAHYYARSS